jgi:hypothetical protein
MSSVTNLSKLYSAILEIRIYLIDLWHFQENLFVLQPYRINKKTALPLI